VQRVADRDVHLGDQAGEGRGTSTEAFSSRPRSRAGRRRGCRRGDEDLTTSTDSTFSPSSGTRSVASSRSSYTSTGLGASDRSRAPRSPCARGRGRPRLAASASRAETAMWAASTSKKRRSAARLSERPKPSVPSATGVFGTTRRSTRGGLDVVAGQDVDAVVPAGTGTPMGCAARRRGAAGSIVAGEAVLVELLVAGDAPTSAATP